MGNIATIFWMMSECTYFTGPAVTTTTCTMRGLGEPCKKAMGIADVLPRSWKYVGANNSIAVWCSI
jgi:hypothetical protein